jgi:hypothetical protein
MAASARLMDLALTVGAVRHILQVTAGQVFEPLLRDHDPC